MEFYIAPAEGRGDLALSRLQVRAALTKAAIAIDSEQEEVPASGDRLFWTVRVRGSDCVLHFQEADGKLVFATLELSVFDASDVPPRICNTLEGLGWETDNESVG